LIQTHPRACLVLIGRGRRAEQVIRQPARELGLEGNLIFAGGRFDDQAEVLAAMDLCTLLVPARDGTCQSLLRAAALGIPMVGTRRGAIPEIISNGQTGLLVEEEPEALASAWRRLMDDPVGRREMGAAARRDARFRFQPDRHAAWMERFYERTRERSLSAVS
jgi:glycosyltransferase involved in cell wall biosynthesis